jgi:predicted aspartyl protease
LGKAAAVGIGFVEVKVTGPTGRSRRVEWLIDSGATGSVLPEEVWRNLGLVPKRTVRFRLADGTPIERSVGECHFALPGADGTSPVVLAEPGDQGLPGAVTLETLGLVFSPFTRTLHPMNLPLANIRSG